jgi:hypothetical protein
MRNNDEEKHMEDPTVHKILILELHMTNEYVSDNYKNEGFGMRIFEDDMLGVLTKSIEIFAQSLRVFTQSSYLLAKSTKKLVQ